MNYDLASRTPPRVILPNTSLDTRSPIVPALAKPAPEIVQLPITGGASAKSPAVPKKSATPYVKTLLTDNEITEKLDGYLKISPKLWEKLPMKCHIRYFKNEPGTRANKFKSGGFVKTLIKDDNGKVTAIVLETQIGGNSKIKGYSSFSISVDSIEELWKKYPYDAFIEIHMMANSFAQKKEENRILSQRIKLLEEDNKEIIYRLKQIEERLSGRK